MSTKSDQHFSYIKRVVLTTIASAGLVSVMYVFTKKIKFIMNFDCILLNLNLKP